MEDIGHAAARRWTDPDFVARAEAWIREGVGESLREAPQPAVAWLSVGSLRIVLDLTPLLIGGGAVALVGRVLYLVKRYWNLPLQLRAEAAELQAAIRQAEREDDAPTAPISRRAMTIALLAEDTEDRRESG